jgi:hypothetical protein
MNFAWWLIKRYAKPIIEFYNARDKNRHQFGDAIFSSVFAFTLDSIGNALVGKHLDDAPFLILTFMTVLFWFVVGAFNLVKHIQSLHAEYVDSDKLKQKHTTEQMTPLRDLFDVETSDTRPIAPPSKPTRDISTR